MTDYEALAVEIDARGVAQLRLNRPDKRNALSEKMIRELTEVAGQLGAAADVRVIVLSGAGDVFCAGADLVWMKAQIGTDRVGRMRAARRLAEMLKALNETPKPVIGKIRGGAFGGGIGLACVCDVAIADESAKFGFTETRFGLIPATIAPYVLARIGEGRARRLFISARVFDAEEARDVGLVARTVAASDLDAAVEAEVEACLAVAPQAAVAAKALAHALGPRIDDAVIEAMAARLADAWDGDEAREGIDAFLGGRRPRWPVSGE